ncbi:hypothetical protein P0F65_07650 [Sphingomonas sp. I4]
MTGADRVSGGPSRSAYWLSAPRMRWPMPIASMLQPPPSSAFTAARPRQSASD